MRPTSRWLASPSRSGRAHLGNACIYSSAFCKFGSQSLFALSFGIISMLYATVGQAGGTAFLALMAFAKFPISEMRPTALALNIVAAAYSTWVFNRQNYVDWAKLRPLLFSSLPAALVGGYLVLDEHIYRTATAIVLLLAAAMTILRRDLLAGRDREAPLPGAIGVGTIVGLVSGITGVGGGVFLAPALIALGWASPKQTAALSAPFILANSVVGLVGALLARQTPSAQLGLYAVVTLCGAIAGTAIGLRWLGQIATKSILAAILVTAALQLLVF